MCERRYVRYVGVGLRARSVEVLQISQALTKWKVWGLFQNSVVSKKKKKKGRIWVRENKDVKKMHRIEVEG